MKSQKRNHQRNAKGHPCANRAESVEEFLARGGKTEQLDRGARGKPVLRSMREMSDENWQQALEQRKAPK